MKADKLTPQEAEMIDYQRHKSHLDSYESGRNPSICWKCRHAVPEGKNGCSWSRYYKPVEGAVMKGNRVHSCPLFDRGEKK